MTPDLTNSAGSNAQNNRVEKNNLKYQLLMPDNLAFLLFRILIFRALMIDIVITRANTLIIFAMTIFRILVPPLLQVHVPLLIRLPLNRYLNIAIFATVQGIVSTLFFSTKNVACMFNQSFVSSNQ